MLKSFKREPRSTYYKTVKHKRDWSFLPYRLLNCYKALLVSVPLAGCAYVLMTYGMPHLLIEHHNTQCSYLGMYGITKTYVAGCPLIAWF